MDVTNTFLPIGIELIDKVFPTNIVYLKTGNPTYDPATGQTTPNVVEHNIKAGILKRNRTEQGGAAEEFEIHFWIHHGPTGIPALPTTADRILYENRYWKAVDIAPTYSSEGLIASKIIARAE